MSSNNRTATIADGMYCAQGGDGRRAERDRFCKMHLTTKGRRNYFAAIVRWERDGNEATLKSEVMVAVDAGY